MTSHQKVEGAAAFAEKLPETAAELYMNNASDNDLAAADKLRRPSGTHQRVRHIGRSLPSTSLAAATRHHRGGHTAGPGYAAVTSLQPRT
jgi:hypothetical protein